MVDDVGVVRAFERDPRTRRGERGEPMRVERQFVLLAPELVEIRRKLIAVFAHHHREPLASAAAITTKSIRRRAEPRARTGRHQRDAIVEGPGDHRGLTDARRSRDDEFGLVHHRVVLEVIDDPHRAPGPAAEDAPVVTGIRGEKARGAKRKTAVRHPQRRVLGAFAGRERDVGEAVLEHRGRAAAHGHRLGGGTAAKSATTATGR